MARKARRGQGSVRRVGRSWEASIQIKGRRFWKNFPSPATEADAWAWLATVRADAVRGTLKVEAPRPEIRFVDLARLYVAHQQLRRRAGTIKYYVGHLKTTLLPALGSRLVSSLTPAELQAFLDAQRRKVAAGAVAKYAQVLGAVLSYGVRMGFLEATPMARVEREKVSAVKSARPFTLEELRAFFAACPARHRPWFLVLFFCGLRKSEMARMEWDWVDLASATLHVRVAKVGSSSIPLAGPAAAALEALGPRASGPVFVSQQRASGDRAISDRRTVLRTVLRRAGLDPRAFSAHSFRHTFATLLEQLGARLSVVKALARHSRISRDVTLRYLHPTDGELRAALRDLSLAVLGPALAAVDRPQSEPAVVRLECGSGPCPTCGAASPGKGEGPRDVLPEAFHEWRARVDSNHRPSDPQSGDQSAGPIPGNVLQISNGRRFGWRLRRRRPSNG